MPLRIFHPSTSATPRCFAP